MNAAHRPPPVDPVAAARWQRMATPHSPWLHEEVARRMQERLDLILLRPQHWLHWAPRRGGLLAHALLRQRYPQATTWALEPDLPAAAQHDLARLLVTPGANASLKAKLLNKLRRSGSHAPRTTPPAPGSIDMLWANMALHMAADPLALLAQWRSYLATDGFLMFSAFGPDTLRELRDLYRQQGWPAPAPAFTDMHNWGDLLVQAGFADPVLDMERITLTFATPQRVLQELRELGRNLAVQRDATTHGRRWLAQLHDALRTLERNGSIALTFEIIYGHAMQPAPRHKLEAATAIPLQDMQNMLRRNPPR